MKNAFMLLMLALTLGACENPYDLVDDSKTYQGLPFVCVSSEQAVIRLGVNPNGNQTELPGVFKDSLVLSHVLDHDLTVVLELVAEETHGELETNFSFQERVTIGAGKNFGAFLVRAIGVPASEVGKYKLSIRVKEVDDAQVIAGLYGAKKENEERKKRFKTYSFQQ